MQKLPPFFGTKIISEINLAEVISLINKEVLFAARWEFRQGQSSEQWQELKQQKIEPIFEKIVFLIQTKHIFNQAKIVYGYFKSKKEGNLLFIYDDQEKPHKFDFPRQRQTPNLCVADFFESGFVALQLVTLGNDVIKYGEKLFAIKNYSDLFYLKGFAAEATEALAQYSHQNIRQELGLSMDQGERFSFGYPALPDLFGQKKLYNLLKGVKIGVKLSETMQLIPEYSTSALISISPQAKFFRP
ncbi:MAG: vitamin B12 dependent-methionine synthase activation domain-containing protein [Pseudomonadota bacterium]